MKNDDKIDSIKTQEVDDDNIIDLKPFASPVSEQPAESPTLTPEQMAERLAIVRKAPPRDKISSLIKKLPSSDDWLEDKEDWKL